MTNMRDNSKTFAQKMRRIASWTSEQNSRSDAFRSESWSHRKISNLAQALSYLEEAQKLSRKQEQQISNLRMQSLRQVVTIKSLEAKLSLAKSSVSVLEKDLRKYEQESDTDSANVNTDHKLHRTLILPSRVTLNESDGGLDSDSDMNLVQTKYEKFRTKVGNFLENETTTKFIIAIILTNCITMGIGTFDFVSTDPHLEHVFENLERLFLVMYTIELYLHFIHKQFSLFRHGWLVFDFLIVILSWLSQIFGGMDVSIIRGFQTLRLLKIVRRLKIMKGVVSAVVSTLPRLATTIGLLLIVLYIFGVFFTNLYISMSDEIESSIYFDRLDHTMFTLVQIMTMDEWVDIGRDMLKESKLSWIPLTAFIFITDAIFLNMIIGIICDGLTGKTDDDDEPHHPLLKNLYRKQERYEEAFDEVNGILYNHMLEQQKTLQYMEFIKSQLGKIENKGQRIHFKKQKADEMYYECVNHNQSSIHDEET